VFVGIGHSLLKKGYYEKSVAILKIATKKDSEDPWAFYFLGVAYNRIGEGVDALKALEKAKELGCGDERLEFETAWALALQKKYEKALKVLEAFLSVFPNDPRGLELAGRCEYYAGNYNQAEKNLEAAIQGDPNLASSANYYLASIKQKRDKRSDAINTYIVNELKRRPGSSIARSLLRAKEAAKRPEGKRWHVRLSLGTGYNTNVLSLTHKHKRPDGVNKRGSFFYETELGLSYELVRTQNDQLDIGYVLNLQYYEGGFKESDMHSHYFYMNYNHRFDEHWSAGLLLGDQYVNIGDTSFMNSISVRPSVAYTGPDWLTSELSYNFVFSDYFNSPEGKDKVRDGVSNQFGLTEYFRIPETDFTGTVGYTFGVDSTRGSDWDRVFNRGSVGLSHPLVWDIDASVGYSITFSDYLNGNSASDTRRTRDDIVHSISAELTRPLPTFGLSFIQDAKIYLRYAYNDSFSNITDYAYRGHIISTGLTFEF
jgi:tetratricopeptide (TPR) repeat protein